MYRKSYLILVLLFFTNCSTHSAPTSMERKMDYKFEKELVKELNKIRRVKGMSAISVQEDFDNRQERNPFSAQMKRGY